MKKLLLGMLLGTMVFAAENVMDDVQVSKSTLRSTFVEQ